MHERIHWQYLDSPYIDCTRNILIRATSNLQDTSSKSQICNYNTACDCSRRSFLCKYCTWDTEKYKRMTVNKRNNEIMSCSVCGWYSWYLKCDKQQCHHLTFLSCYQPIFRSTYKILSKPLLQRPEIVWSALKNNAMANIPTYIFGMSRNIISRFAVVGTFREPFFDCVTICRGVVISSTLEAERRIE